MKFSRKMILIPATGREEPETEKMSELDHEMSAILKNPRLSVKEKVEMYSEVLRRNLIFESRLQQKPAGIENKIEPVVSPMNETSYDETGKSYSTSLPTSSISDLKSEEISLNLKGPLKNKIEQKVFLESDEDIDVDDDDLKNLFPVKKPHWENYTQGSTPKFDYENQRPYRSSRNKIDYFESADSLEASLKKRKKLKRQNN